MPLRAKHHRPSLQAHSIYLRDIEDIDTCPTELQDLFKLIENVRHLKSDHFGGYGTSASGPLFVKSSPRQQYEKELKEEAEKLADNCMAKRRADDSESKWVGTLEPIVFHRFDQDQEEKYARGRHHHWLVATGEDWSCRTRITLTQFHLPETLSSQQSAFDQQNERKIHFNQCEEVVRG